MSLKNKEEDSILDFTGERLTTKIYEYWVIEHLHRYALASNLAKGKKVLDIACGEGYGSSLLANVADSVVGADISREAVEHASKKYIKGNLKFLHGSATEIPLESNSIDVVVSFETIEHHDQHIRMLEELKRVLKTDGILIMSSPDKKYYTDIPGYNNPYHVKELYENEFKDLITTYFKKSIFLNQKAVFGSVITPAKPSVIELMEYTGNYSGIQANEGLQGALYNICIASDSDINISEHAQNSIFSDGDMMAMYIKAKEERDDLRKINEITARNLSSPFYLMKQLVKYPVKVIRNSLKK